MNVVIRLKNGATAKFVFADVDGVTWTHEQIRAFVKQESPEAATILVRVK